jgi:maleylpyruvate isomerase
MSLEDNLRWSADGTARFLSAAAEMPDDRLDGPCRLPDWTGRHLLAHVALNAEALLNLATWARTGIETPMYASPDRREADIEAGSRLPAAELRDRLAETAVALDAGLAGLTGEQWQRPVRTRIGRAVPATTIPWMRAREVMIHTVDLGTGVTFDDLPHDFLAALIEDIAAMRAGNGPGLTLSATDRPGTWSIPGAGKRTPVKGTLGSLAAYLSGREPGLPALPRWL